MTYEMKDNTGTLFKNDKKEKDTHADYQGTALVDGVEYWFNAWVKQGKSGKFFSCSFRQKTNAPAKASPKSGVEELEDDLPF